MRLGRYNSHSIKKTTTLQIFVQEQVFGLTDIHRKIVAAADELVEEVCEEQSYD